MVCSRYRSNNNSGDEVFPKLNIYFNLFCKIFKGVKWIIPLSDPGVWLLLQNLTVLRLVSFEPPDF